MSDFHGLFFFCLELSFASIISVPQEAAYDADKVFLAAIDKFDTMMSKGNVYAPDGTFMSIL